MTFHDVTVLVTALAVVGLPGAALLVALGVRRPLHFVGLVPSASVGVASLTSTGCGLLGLPFGPAALAGVTAALAVVALVVALRAQDRTRGSRAGLVVRLAAAAMLLTGLVLGLVTWLRGLGSLTTVPQEHDTIIHLVLVSYVQRTGRGAPWQLLPADVLTGGHVQFYPAGMHLLSAVTGTLASGSVEGLNAVTVVLLAFGLATSAAALAFVAARRAGLGLSGGLLAGGLAAIIAEGLYRPTISLAHEGGILPNAAALALTPGVVAALLTVPRRGWSVAVATGVACAGLLSLHPSAIVSVGLTVVAWWVGDALRGGGLRRVRTQFVPLAVVLLTVGVLAAPLLYLGVRANGRTSAFPADTGPTDLFSALGDTIGLRFQGYLGTYRGLTQVVAEALLLLGVAVVVVTRRGLGALTAWLAWVVVTLCALVVPGRGPVALVTGFFYNAMLRVMGNLWLFVPVLGALGVVSGAGALAGWLRRRLPGRGGPRTWSLVTTAVVLVAAGYTAWPAGGYASVNADYLAARYATPQFVRVSEDDRRAAAFLADRVGTGQRVMNSANDGSTFAYVDSGVPVVNVAPLGLASAPYTYRLLESFNSYPTDRDIRNLLLDLNVGWVYVDADAPVIGAAGSPRDWAGRGVFQFAPGLSNLRGLPGLVRVFRSGSVTVYRLDLGVLRSL